MKREDAPPSSILTLSPEGRPSQFGSVEPLPRAPEVEGDGDLVLGQVDPLIDQVDNLHAFARTGLVGNTVGACVVVALYAHVVPTLHSWPPSAHVRCSVTAPEPRSKSFLMILT